MLNAGLIKLIHFMISKREGLVQVRLHHDKNASSFVDCKVHTVLMGKGPFQCPWEQVGRLARCTRQRARTSPHARL